MHPIDPQKYRYQLGQKLAKLRDDFADLLTPDIEVFESQPLNFRMRAEFRIWHEGDEVYFAMTPLGERRPQPIENFPIGSQQINERMPELLNGVRGNRILREKLFACEFLTTLSGEALIILLYHKPLDEQWRTEAKELQASLKTPIIGRSRKQKVALMRDHVTEQFEVDGKTFTYRQVESGFTQPNAGVNRKMLSWARSCVLDMEQPTPKGDLLELYCGNGNFTMALAEFFRRVLATEVSKISVKSALHNAEINGIDNLKIVRMSSEEFSDALKGVRIFRRLRDQEIDLADYHFSTLLVDPPRSGLDAGTVELARRFDHILYISCNPQTLKQNLETLCQTHRIRRLAAFDQFPYTEHLECGVYLTRRPFETSLSPKKLPYSDGFGIGPTSDFSWLLARPNLGLVLAVAPHAL